jgi:hypothetical protein
MRVLVELAHMVVRRVQAQQAVQVELVHITQAA